MQHQHCRGIRVSSLPAGFFALAYQSEVIPDSPVNLASLGDDCNGYRPCNKDG